MLQASVPAKCVGPFLGTRCNGVVPGLKTVELKVHLFQYLPIFAYSHRTVLETAAYAFHCVPKENCFVASLSVL